MLFIENLLLFYLHASNFNFVPIVPKKANFFALYKVNIPVHLVIEHC